jgi:N-acylneuraminate cytidylyltransferase/CMP-N,N'-diacetyllegionaminic acid synthase
VYFFDGTIYISEVKSLADLRTFYHKRTLPYIVPRWKSLEIDEISDMVCAKALLKARKKKLF